MYCIAVILIILGLIKLFIASKTNVDSILDNPLPVTKKQIHIFFQGVVIFDALVCLLAGFYILCI